MNGGNAADRADTVRPAPVLYLAGLRLTGRRVTGTAAGALLGGCAGPQSTFSAFGLEAASTRILTLGMAAAAALITGGVGWLVLHAVRTPAGRLDHRHGMRAILWLGAIGPTLLLTTLLVLSLPDRKSTRLNSSHSCASRMPSSA